MHGAGHEFTRHKQIGDDEQKSHMRGVGMNDIVFFRSQGSFQSPKKTSQRIIARKQSDRLGDIQARFKIGA
jgi:hypothetical protein